MARQVSLVALALALLAASFLPAHIEPPPAPAPYARASCWELERLAAEVRRDGGSRLVVVSIPEVPGEPCAELRARFMGGPGLVVRGTSDVLLELRQYHGPTAKEVCLGCSIVRPSSPARAFARLVRRGGGPLLVLMGLGALVVAAMTRARRPRLPTLPAARRAFPELAPTAARTVELQPEGGVSASVGGPFVWLEGGSLRSGPTAPSGPHLRLAASSGAAFREGASPWPTFVGPGRVSGLPVGAGEEVPVASGDVLRFGHGPPMRARFADLDAVPLRLRLADEGYRLGLAMSPTRRQPVLLATTAASSGLPMVAAAWMTPEVHLGALALALGAVIALGKLAYAPVLGRVSASDGGLVYAPPTGAPQHIRGITVIRSADASVVQAVLETGQTVVLETIPPGKGLEARALAEQWIREAEQLARVLEPT
jgi:hypothetical protein